MGDLLVVYQSLSQYLIVISVIVLFHNDFSTSGEQPEHRILAHKLYQPTAGCKAILLLYKTRGYYKKYSKKLLRVYYWYVKYHNAGTLKYITFYVQKHIADSTMGSIHR